MKGHAARPSTMSLATTVSQVLHLAFAAVWTGSVVFVTWAVLPGARAGDFDAAPLAPVVSKLRTLTRVGAVVFLATGAHMAQASYTSETLFSTTRGHLVLGMVVLWLVLTGLVEVGAGRFLSGLDELKVRAPATEARPLFLAASVVALALLVDAGLLAAGVA